MGLLRRLLWRSRCVKKKLEEASRTIKPPRIIKRCWGSGDVLLEEEEEEELDDREVDEFKVVVVFLRLVEEEDI